MKIEAIDKSCVAIGLRRVSGKTDDEVIKACLNQGWQMGKRGMHHTQWLPAAASLGLKLSRINLPLEIETLGQFRKRHKKGVYLIIVNRHLLVMEYGRIYDLLGVRLRRKVYSAFLVRNPAMECASTIKRIPKDPLIHAPRGVRRFGTFIIHSEPVRFSDLRPLGYSRQMLRRDIRTGKVEVVK